MKIILGLLAAVYIVIIYSCLVVSGDSDKRDGLK